jgi:multicomponent Na+:H+ antiporter subunit F
MSPDALFLAVAASATLLTLPYLYRLVAGPTVFDRMLGLSGFGTSTTVILLLLGAIYGRLEMFVDIALGYALLNFVGVLAAARYFERTRG